MLNRSRIALLVLEVVLRARKSTASFLANTALACPSNVVCSLQTVCSAHSRCSAPESVPAMIVASSSVLTLVSPPCLSTATINWGKTLYINKGRSGGAPERGVTSTNVMIRRHVSVSPRLAATHSSVQSNKRNLEGVVMVRHRPTSMRGTLCCRANAKASRISRLGNSRNASGVVVVGFS